MLNREAFGNTGQIWPIGVEMEGDKSRDFREVINMNGKGNTDRLHDANNWQRLRIVLLAILVASAVLFSACGKETAQGTITGAYQPLRSGMVQMYIEVELGDGTEVSARLPVEQEIWDKVSRSVRSGGHLRVEIQRKGSEESWEFVRFLDE